jgi:ADP-heptose:LPS heptosyltransferase
VKLIIFIQRKRALGDVLWIEPLIRHLAQKYYFVVVNTLFAELYDNYPLKNVFFRKNQHRIIKIIREISKAIFGSIGFLDLDNVYEKSPRMHILQAYLIEAGYPDVPLSLPKVYPKSQDRINNKKKNVVIHLSAPSFRKNFRTIEGIDWVQIKNYFEDRNFDVIGISDDPIHTNFYSEILNPSIQELITIIDNCDMFIGLDSGPAHIAASLKKPSIVFFGSVNPEFRFLMNEFNGKIMQQPCIYAGCYHDFLDSAKRHCLLVDDSYAAPCCRFTTEELLYAIESLQSK